MAFIIKDRVKENTTSTGTGAVSLGGAAATFDTFQSYMTNGDTTYYAIVHTTSGTDEWEVGLGTWNTGNTLTRTTVLAGSNGTSSVDFSAGTKDVFMTYPASKAAVAGEDVTFADITVTGTVDGRDVAADGTKLDGIDTSADVTDATTVAAAGALMKSGGTMTGNLILNADPTTALGAATKEYVDTIASAGIHYHDPVRVEAPSALTVTYDNGSSGVGATLTNAGTQAAISIDGVALSLNDRVLIYNQTDQTQNGVYTVTTVGSTSTNWVLTRSTDTDSYGASDPDSFGKGDAFFVKEGNTGAGELYVMTTAGTITFGTTNIVFSQVAETAVYSAGTGLTLTGTTFSIGQDVGTTANVTFNQVTAAIIGNVTGNLTGDVTGNADTATALETARTIQLSGDVTGSATFDGSANVTITAAVQDDSHAHVISNVDGLQTALDGKVPTTRTITAGNGLTGGGDLSANRTLTVGGGTGVTVNANDIAIGQDVATTASPTFAGATFTGNVSWGDNDYAFFGAGNDLNIYHDGNSVITNANGTLFIQTTVDDGDIRFRSDNGTGGVADYILLDGSTGQTQLFHYGNQKLNTNSSGITVTGTTLTDALNVSNGTTILSQASDNVIRSNSDSSRVRVFGGSSASVGNGAALTLHGASQASGYADLASATSGYITFRTGTTERMRITNAGSVGIGTNSPSLPLEVYHASNSRIVASTSSTGASQFCFGDDVDDYVGRIYYDHTGNTMRFHANTSERMRIDSSGNLLVGKTATGLANQGAEFSSTGQVKGTAPNQVVGYFNRTSSDGDILEFRKDNTTVGSIGTASGVPYFYGSSGFRLGGSIQPVTSAGALSDNTTDIGQSNARFKDLYLSSNLKVGGTNSFQFQKSGNHGYINMADTGSLIIRNGTGFTERMRIDSSGNVGIGTSSPAQLLHVQAGATGNGTIRVGGGAGLEISHDNSANTVQRIDSLYRTTNAGANLQLRTGILTVHTGTSSTERMRIDSSGNVGIGTSDPQAVLDVESSTDNKWALRVQGNTNNASGVWTGIGLAGEDANTKAGILFEDSGSSHSRGSVIIASNDNADNTTNVSTSDQVARFNRDKTTQFYGTVKIPARIEHVGDSDTYHEFNAANSWRVVTGNTEGLKVSGNNVDVPDAIRHTGDTNTYMQFHAGDQWRVVTGGTERLEVNNSTTTVQNRLQVEGGSKLEVQNGNDGGTSHGLYMWSLADTNWVQYMSTSGSGKAPDGGTAPSPISGGTSHQFRFRAHNTSNHGFVFENSSDQTLMNIRGDNGHMYVRGNIYANNSTSNRVFADNYHPNADKWTTARTLSLSGDASGSVSWDGSANATLSVTVANDSHNHDGRYYTESEINTKLTDGSVKKAGFDSNGRFTVEDSNGAIQLFSNDGGGNIGIRFNSDDNQNSKENGSAWEIEVNNDSTNSYIKFSTDASIGGANEAISWSEEFRFDHDGDFHADGNIIAYSTTTSDPRLKENIQPVTDGLEKVTQLNGYTFDYKADGVASAGILSTEVAKVLPSAVKQSKLGLKLGDDNQTEYDIVQYDQLAALFIEAIKELKAEIDELKAKLGDK